MPPPDPAALKQTWRYTLDALTPLHIGAGGDPLHKDLDFIVTRGDVVVLDPEETFERIYQAALGSTPAAPTLLETTETAIARQMRQLGLLTEEPEDAAAPRPRWAPPPCWRGWPRG